MNVIRRIAKSFRSYVGHDLAGRELVELAELVAWWRSKLPDLVGCPLDNVQINAATYFGMHRYGFRKRAHGGFYRPDVIIKRPVPKPERPGPVFEDGGAVAPIDDSKALVQILRDATTLCADFEDGEPRIADDVLGSFLGYSQPAQIRELIKRNSEKMGVIRTARITSGAAGGRPGIRHFLTERQCLQVVRWSDTPKADECYAHVVDVFLAWRAGKKLTVPPPPPSTAMVSAIPDYMNEILLKLEAQREEYRARDGARDARLFEVVTSVTKAMEVNTKLADAVTRLVNLKTSQVESAPDSSARLAPPPWSLTDWPAGKPPPKFCASAFAFLSNYKVKVDKNELDARAKRLCAERRIEAYSLVTRGLTWPERWYPLAILREAYNVMLAEKKRVAS